MPFSFFPLLNLLFCISFGKEGCKYCSAVLHLNCASGLCALPLLKHSSLFPWEARHKLYFYLLQSCLDCMVWVAATVSFLFFLFFFFHNVKVVYNSCHRATSFNYSNDINNLRAISSLFVRPIIVAYIIVVEKKNRNVPTAAGARIGMFSCTDDTGVFLFVLRSAFPASSENTEQHAFLWVLRAGMGLWGGERLEMGNVGYLL